MASLIESNAHALGRCPQEVLRFFIFSKSTPSSDDHYMFKMTEGGGAPGVTELRKSETRQGEGATVQTPVRRCRVCRTPASGVVGFGTNGPIPPEADFIRKYLKVYAAGVGLP